MKIKKWEKRFRIVEFYAIVIAFCLYQQGVFSFPWKQLEPFLIDSDCYMHLLRVIHFEAFHSWDYLPYLHWTTLFDWMLWAGAKCGEPFMGFEMALHWWGIVISPLISIGSLCVLFWTFKPYIRRPELVGRLAAKGNNDIKFPCWRLCMTVMSLGMPGFWCYSKLGFSDHHAWMFFLFVVMLGCLLRMVETGGWKYPVIGGVAAALGVYDGVEFIMAVVMVHAALFWLWVYGKEKDVCYSKIACRFSFIIAISEFGLLLSERSWAGLLTVEYDKISVVHLFVFLVACGFWLVMDLAPRARAVKARVGLGLAGVLAAGAIILCKFPLIIYGGYAVLNPEIQRLWMSQVKEAQPLLLHMDSVMGISRLVSMWGLAFIVLPFGSYVTWLNRKMLPKLWVVFWAGVLVWLPLSFYQIRCLPYLEIIMLFPTVILGYKAMSYPWKVKPDSKWIVDEVIVFILTFSPAFISMLILWVGILTGSMTIPPQYVNRLEDSLSIFQKIKEEQGTKTVLTYIDFGAEIAYYSSHKIVACPYHRNSDGMLLLYNVMTAETDAEALELLKQGNVDIVALYPTGCEKIFYLKTDKEDTFYKRFLDGKYPKWLTPIKVPEELDGDCYLFEVKNEEERL